VLPPDLDALKLAISEDGASRDKKLGTKVAGWIGRMVSKAASGVWTVGTSTAVSVLPKLIEKYYGLSSGP
jgi:hypothetical protein